MDALPVSLLGCSAYIDAELSPCMSQVFDFVGNLNIEATTHQSKLKFIRSSDTITPVTHVGSRDDSYNCCGEKVFIDSLH